MPEPTDTDAAAELRDTVLHRLLGADDEMPEAPEAARPWRVGDPVEHRGTELDAEAAAAWLLRKVQRADEALRLAHLRYTEERRRLMAAIEPELELLDEWLADATSGAEAEHAWATDRLEEWALRGRADGADGWPKGQASVSTPAGKVGTRLGRTELVRPEGDEALAELVAWLADHGNGDLLQVSVRWAELAKLVEPVGDPTEQQPVPVQLDGEQLPHVQLARKRTTVQL